MGGKFISTPTRRRSTNRRALSAYVLAALRALWSYFPPDVSQGSYFALAALLESVQPGRRPGWPFSHFPSLSFLGPRVMAL